MSSEITPKANEQLDFLCELLNSHGLVPICSKLNDLQRDTHIEVMGKSPLKIHCQVYAQNEVRFSYMKSKSRVQMRLMLSETGFKIFGKEEFFKHLLTLIEGNAS